MLVNISKVSDKLEAFREFCVSVRNSRGGFVIILKRMACFSSIILSC